MRTRPLFIVSLLTLITSLLLNLAIARTEIMTGKVENVVDGNTIIVQVESEKVRVRLYGIVCPDEGQPFEDLAKNAINDLIMGDQVELIPEYKDRYGRLIATVYVRKINISEALIKKGYALVYPEYCKKSFCSDWYNLERAARKQKLGIWSDPIFNR